MPTARLLILATSLLAAACATGPEATTGAPVADRAYDLQLENDNITLTLRREMPLPEFLQLCQQVTQETYSYRADDLSDRGPVKLLGKIDCERAHFPGFVQTMLYVHGLRVEPTQAPGVLQVVPIEPTRRS